MTQAVIRKTFLEALNTFAENHNPPLTIARENVSFLKPTDGAPYMEVYIIPADTIVATISGERRRFRGTCQVNIYTTENDGAGVAEDIAEELYQLFPVMPKNHLPVSIESPVQIKRAVGDGTGWFVTPCLIEYRLESEN